MNLHPWKLYRLDGSAEPGTDEIVATLETVLRRNPNHIGAMHLYIHAVEASSRPEWALPYADRIATLAPAAGHLVHMPAHIYERTGNYDGARVNNAMAAKADQAYAAATGSMGIYMTMYYSHNLHFGAIAASMEGHCEDAVKFAEQLATNLRPMAKEMPMVEPFLGMPYAMAVRCGRWDELLVMPQPAAQTAALKGYMIYGRGMALAAKGKLSASRRGAHAARRRGECDGAGRDLHASSGEPYMADRPHRRRRARSPHCRRQRRKTAAIQFLRDAVAVQDQLLYDEPPDWYFPVRESLGGMLLKTGDALRPNVCFGRISIRIRAIRDRCSGWPRLLGDKNGCMKPESWRPSFRTNGAVLTYSSESTTYEATFPANDLQVGELLLRKSEYLVCIMLSEHPNDEVLLAYLDGEVSRAGARSGTIQHSVNVTLNLQ